MKSFAMRHLKQVSTYLGLLVTLGMPLASCSSPGNNSGAADNAVQVGVLVIRDIESARQRYGPILEHVSSQIGRPVTLVPLTQQSQFIEVERGTVDFVISNPLASQQLSRLYDTEILTTQSQPGTGSSLGGIIIVRSDSAIGQVQDLRDKQGACVSLETAAGGCLFQMQHLQESGINPYLDLAGITEVPSQNDIVRGVIDGQYEFGFVRTGQLENMVNRGLITDAAQVKVLSPQQDSNFALDHTTRLYPSWGVAATSDTASELSTAVEQALLGLTPDSPALAETGLDGFVDAADYAPIDQIITGFKLASWDAP